MNAHANTMFRTRGFWTKMFEQTLFLTGIGTLQWRAVAKLGFHVHAICRPIGLQQSCLSLPTGVYEVKEVGTARGDLQRKLQNLSKRKKI